MWAELWHSELRGAHVAWRHHLLRFEPSARWRNPLSLTLCWLCSAVQDDISKKVLTKLKKYIDDPDFQPAKLENVSTVRSAGLAWSREVALERPASAPRVASCL